MVSVRVGLGSGYVNVKLGLGLGLWLGQRLRLLHGLWLKVAQGLDKE
jgi:hypothetical protein